MKAWSDVIQNPEFQSLSPQEKYNAQLQYFMEVVRPNVPKEKLNEARNEFFGQYKPDIYNFDPTQGMSETGKFIAGTGKSFVDIGRGVRQILQPSAQKNLSSLVTGIESPSDEQLGMFVDKSLPKDVQQQKINDLRKDWIESHTKLQNEVDESRRLDSPLIKSTAGLSGNITGNVAAALPSMFVPGANTISGSAVLGGVYGALQPTATGEDRSQNATTGAIISGGTTAAMKAIPAIYRGVKSFFEPFTKSGQESIAARTLQRFAADPNSIIKSGPYNLTPGVNQTLAETTADPGIANLQRAIQSAEPDFASELATRQLQNNAARIEALKKIGGDKEALKAATAARNSASEPLYAIASTKTVPIDDTFNGLLSRPSMQKAMQRAQQIASENGDQFVSNNGQLPVKSLNYVKMALDDMLDSSALSGIGKHEKAAILSTKNSLLDWLDKSVPEYAQARQAYADASKPITQMKVINTLIGKGSSATEDSLGNPTLYPNKFNAALNNAEKLVRTSGGLRSQGLGDVLTPEQLGTITQIGKELSTQQNAQNAARAAGSNTAQNLSSQNIIAQSGIPNAIAKPLNAFRWIRPIDFSYQDSAIRQKLAEALLNPERAKELLKTSGNKSPEKIAKILESLRTPAEMSAVPYLVNSGQ